MIPCKLPSDTEAPPDADQAPQQAHEQRSNETLPLAHYRQLFDLAPMGYLSLIHI